jgi:hypothetical protein
MFLWLWAIWKHPNLTLTGLEYATISMKLSLQSSSAFRVKRCEEVLNDPAFRNPVNSKLLRDFTCLTEKLIELTEKPIGGVSFNNFIFKNSFMYRKHLHILQFSGKKYLYRRVLNPLAPNDSCRAVQGGGLISKRCSVGSKQFWSLLYGPVLVYPWYFLFVRVCMEKIKPSNLNPSILQNSHWINLVPED